MKRIIVPALAILMVLGMSACKPTEKNYQAAYEAAQRKREASKAAEADLAIPATFHREGERPRQKIDGYVVETTTDFLKLVKGEDDALKEWNVAVGCYKMKTNAISRMDALVKEGYKAYVAENPESKFYVFSGGAPTISEAAKLASGFASKNDSSTFVGLNGAPLLIQKRW